MLFYKVTSEGPVINFIAEALRSRLRGGQSVLWLVTGGSCIAVAAAVSKQLVGTPLDKLTVTPTDERYGPVGHPDSNWQQLQAAGLDLPGAKLLPVLSGKTQAVTTKEWSQTLDAALNSADYRLALFGIGPDGHIAGVLPHSPVVSASETAVSYQSEAIPGVRPPFQRISMSLTTITRLDEAVVYTTGEAKRPVLDRLETEQSLEDQPSQILKRVAAVTIFNDYKGEQL